MRVTKIAGAYTFSASDKKKNENSPAFKAIITETNTGFLMDLLEKAARRGRGSQPSNLFDAFDMGRSLLKEQLVRLSDDLRINLRPHLWTGATFFGFGDRVANISVTAFFENAEKQKAFFQRFRPEALNYDLPDAILLPMIKGRNSKEMMESFKKNGYRFLNNAGVADAFKHEYIQQELAKDAKPTKFQEFVNNLFLATRNMDVKEL